MCDIDDGENATDVHNEADRRVGNDSIICGRTDFRQPWLPILLFFDYPTLGSEGLMDRLGTNPTTMTARPPCLIPGN